MASFLNREFSYLHAKSTYSRQGLEKCLSLFLHPPPLLSPWGFTTNLKKGRIRGGVGGGASLRKNCSRDTSKTSHSLWGQKYNFHRQLFSRWKSVMCVCTRKRAGKIFRDKRSEMAAEVAGIMRYLTQMRMNWKGIWTQIAVCVPAEMVFCLVFIIILLVNWVTTCFSSSTSKKLLVDG